MEADPVVREAGVRLGRIRRVVRDHHLDPPPQQPAGSVDLVDREVDRIDQIIAYYDELEFVDWTYPETGTPMLKAQHPEFEFFTAGSTHYNAGVACPDCHMPYVRVGAQKVSDHHVRSPLLNISNACQTRHKWPEQEMLARAALRITLIDVSHDPLDFRAADVRNDDRRHAFGHPVVQRDQVVAQSGDVLGVALPHDDSALRGGVGAAWAGPRDRSHHHPAVGQPLDTGELPGTPMLQADGAS